MGLTAFFADSVVTDGQTHAETAVLVADGRIQALPSFQEVPAAATRVKLTGLTLAAGLVDAQVNGGGGVFFNADISVEGIEKIFAAHRAWGTTSFLPTLISDDISKMNDAIDAVAAYRQKYGEDAGVLGVHLEGPFLNKNRKGIHAEEKITRPDLSFLKNKNLQAAGKILLTIAPEQFEENDLKALYAAGVILSAGHSMADKEHIKKAKKYGLSGITHLFNGMGGVAARQTGLAAIALADDALFCSIILDGQHVDKAGIELAQTSKPKDKLFMVSDAMPPAGEKDKKDFILMGQRIFVRNGRCENAEGRLAGSAQTLFECVRLAYKEFGISLPHCLYMASTIPTQFLGLEKNIGALAVGKRADMIAFDTDLNLKSVYRGGKPI